MDNFGTVRGTSPLRKTAFDVGTLAGIVPHVGLALGLHVGGNALLKPFLAGKMGGAAAQQAPPWSLGDRPSPYGEGKGQSGQSSCTSPLRFRTRTARLTTISSRSLRAGSS